MFTVPNEASATHAPQAAVDSTDIDALQAALQQTGVSAVVGATGLLVTAHGGTMSVDVAAGTALVVGGDVVVSAVTGLAIAAADASHDRRDIVVVNLLGVVSVVTGTVSTDTTNGVTVPGGRDPAKPAIPANSVLLAEVYVQKAATTIVAGDIIDKRCAVGQLGDVETLPTFNVGLSIPVGKGLGVGTRTVTSGTRSTTTNASDTVDLGTFSTTGGALELRIHAHLVAGVGGATASVTKVYEIAAGALMGTVSTWYLCLPADASANAAATNDFALEVQRTASGTFQFRFRQKSIGSTGVITFELETLGDTVVTFTASTSVTAAPTAVTTVHPSNAFTAAAGNVGIGTDAPATLLHVAGTVTVNDLLVAESAANRSVPRGMIGQWRQGATTGTNITASATEVALFSGVSPTIGTWAFVSGRRYLFYVRISGAVTTASATARLDFLLHLGTGTAGTVLARSMNPINSSATVSYQFFGDALCGTDFTAGTSTLTISGIFTASNTFTVLGGGQVPQFSAEIVVVDVTNQ